MSARKAPLGQLPSLVGAFAPEPDNHLRSTRKPVATEWVSWNVKGAGNMMVRLLDYRRLSTSCIVLVAFFALPAHADFFDDARQTFQKDIPHFFQNDVPHFFQDDIPCAFGGQPTSHTKTSCKDNGHATPGPAGNAKAQESQPPVQHEEARKPTVYDQ